MSVNHITKNLWFIQYAYIWYYNHKVKIMRAGWLFLHFSGGEYILHFTKKK